MPRLRGRLTANKETMHEVMQVARGEAEADLAIVNGTIVNVYTREVISGNAVLTKGDKIAYVGENVDKAIGSSTQIIDASGKILIPGLIDGHTHANSTYSPSELARFAIKGGTTTIITEADGFVYLLGYQGIVEFLKSIRNQPIKIFVTAPPMVIIGPFSGKYLMTANELRKLLRKREVLGLGESNWAGVNTGDPRLLDLIAETTKTGKKAEGHSAGAKGKKLQAYIATGISSCHEPISVEEVLERLRAGITVFAREGEVRKDLEVLVGIKDEKIDFRYLALVSDSVKPWQLCNDGYMDYIVQKAINLGFDPVVAIQMATINVARHFAIDDAIGGIAPGKYADIVIIPDLRTIKPECVISNGQLVAQNGQVTVRPRKYNYPESMRHCINLPRSFTASDFAIPVRDDIGQVRVRVMDLVTDFITREAIIDVAVLDGLAQLDASKDVLKIGAIERTYEPGKTFVGFIRGVGLKRGAIATSIAWDSQDILVIGANEVDMAHAVNRVAELQGGMVVYASNEILAEISMPIVGILSTEPMETISDKLYEVQRAASSLGCNLPDIRASLSFLTSGSIPFLRVCEQGLIDLKRNSLVDLIVD